MQAVGPGKCLFPPTLAQKLSGKGIFQLFSVHMDCTLWNQYLNHLLHNLIKKSQNIMEYKIVDNKTICLKIFEHWRKNWPNCVYSVKCKIGSLLVQLSRNLSVSHKVLLFTDKLAV